MPRQSRGPAPAPKRPMAPPAAPQRTAAQQPPNARQASTAAYPRPSPPAAQQHPPAPAPQPQAQQSSGPGLFGQMASTAAGVAVGSSIGHAIGGLFSGGGSSQPAATAEPSQPVAQAENGQYAMNQNYQAAQVCEKDVANFRQCLDQNQGDLTICGWYLDQLKACQATAAQYS